MNTTTVPRASVLAIIRNAADALRSERVRPDDGARIAAELARACEEAGVPARAFDSAVAADVDLERLKTSALDEALDGRADPGPYAAISRESPSGQPGDT